MVAQADDACLSEAIALQFASMAWQYGTMRAKYHLRDVPPLMSSSFQMLSGGIVVAIIGLTTGELRRLTFTTEGIASLAYLTMFGSVLAYTAYVYAVGKIRVTTLSLYAYINPLVAVMLGWQILKEQLTPMSGVAIVIILGGVALVQTPGRRIEHARVSATRRGSR